jgi:hypothetical protein
MLTGFVRTINEYVKEDSASVLMEFNLESNNFNLFLNCAQTDVDKALALPVPSDKIDFGVSNNVLNFLLPYSNTLYFKTIIERAFTMIPMFLNVVEDYSLR